MLLFLLALRIVNALTLTTFFQPDEYYQSLEPAWHLAFGVNSGAWITWVGYQPQTPVGKKTINRTRADHNRRSGGTS